MKCSCYSLPSFHSAAATGMTKSRSHLFPDFAHMLTRTITLGCCACRPQRTLTGDAPFSYNVCTHWLVGAWKHHTLPWSGEKECWDGARAHGASGESSSLMLRKEVLEALQVKFQYSKAVLPKHVISSPSDTLSLLKVYALKRRKLDWALTKYLSLKRNFISLSNSAPFLERKQWGLKRDE